MSAKPARVGDFLTARQVRALRGKSDLVGSLLVMHAWATIGASMILFAWWPNPVTFLLAVMVIGARQLGLAILMHDAAHGLLFADRRLNELTGAWLCAFPVFTSMTAYRPYHLKHHRATQQPDDPDLGLSAPFPITRNSLRRKLVRDLTGQTAFHRRRQQIRKAMGAQELPLALRLANLVQNERGGLIVNAALWAMLAAVGYWWLYPVLWLLPLATWYQLVSRVRNIAEHAVVPNDDDPLRNTRTTRAGPLARLLVAPYWVNYHLEHHLFTFVPCWRLPQTHRALLAGGHGPHMELKSSYLVVLEAATVRAMDRPGPSGVDEPPKGTAQLI